MQVEEMIFSDVLLFEGFDQDRKDGLIVLFLQPLFIGKQDRCLVLAMTSVRRVRTFTAHPFDIAVLIDIDADIIKIAVPDSCRDDTAAFLQVLHEALLIIVPPSLQDLGVEPVMPWLQFFHQLHYTKKEVLFFVVLLIPFRKF